MTSSSQGITREGLIDDVVVTPRRDYAAQRSSPRLDVHAKNSFRPFVRAKWIPWRIPLPHYPHTLPLFSSCCWGFVDRFVWFSLWIWMRSCGFFYLFFSIVDLVIVFFVLLYRVTLFTKCKIIQNFRINECYWMIIRSFKILECMFFFVQ